MRGLDGEVVEEDKHAPVSRVLRVEAGAEAGQQKEGEERQRPAGGRHCAACNGPGVR